MRTTDFKKSLQKRMGNANRLTPTKKTDRSMQVLCFVMCNVTSSWDLKNPQIPWFVLPTFSTEIRSFLRTVEIICCMVRTDSKDAGLSAEHTRRTTPLPWLSGTGGPFVIAVAEAVLPTLWTAHRTNIPFQQDCELGKAPGNGRVVDPAECIDSVSMGF